MGQKTKQTYYYKNWDLEFYIRALGDEARTEFMNWINSIEPRHRYRNNAINYDFGISYANNLFRVGEHMVYLYTDEHGIPFYVGKGGADRAVNIANRSAAFKDAITKGETCRIFAIVFDIMEEDALRVETLVINELLNRGWRLANSAKLSVGQDELGELRDSYPSVTNVLDRITSKAIDYLLADRDPFGDNGRVCIANKTCVKPVSEVGA